MRLLKTLFCIVGDFVSSLFLDKKKRTEIFLKFEPNIFVTDGFFDQTMKNLDNETKIDETVTNVMFEVPKSTKSEHGGRILDHLTTKYPEAMLCVKHSEKRFFRNEQNMGIGAAVVYVSLLLVVLAIAWEHKDNGLSRFLQSLDLPRKVTAVIRSVTYVIDNFFDSLANLLWRRKAL